MSNFQAINANNIQLGEDTGVCSVKPAPNRDRIKSQMDLVDSNGANVIDFNQSTNTIDFNGKTVANFTGGGGGGGGDVFLANTQSFTGVNTFTANTVLTTADTGNLSTTGTITASSTVTGSGLITAGTVECNKVESVGNVEISTGNLVVTTGTGLFGNFITSNGIGNTGDISTTTQTTTSNHIIGGDCVVTGQIVGNGGLSINSGTSAVQALTTNNVVTTGTITASAEIQGSSLAAAGGNINCPGGTINGFSLQSAGGQVLLKTGNARIEDDVNNDLRIQANTNGDTIVFRLGATGADNLQLSYDSVTNKSVLRLYDFSASPPQYYNVGASPDDLANLIASLNNTSLSFNPSTTETFEGSLISTGTTTLSGSVINLGTGANVATITCMNDSGDALNINDGVVTLNNIATLAKTGSVSGATDIFTATDTILDRSATSFTPTLFTLVTGTPGAGEVQLASGITNSLQGSIQAVRFGTNAGTPVYRVSCRGRLSGFSVNNIGAGSGSIDLFTLPLGYRPIQEQNLIAMGHPDEKQVRIDIATSGLVSIAEGASSNLASFCNLGGIDIWAGI
jgi:hypothetical protein